MHTFPRSVVSAQLNPSRILMAGASRALVTIAALCLWLALTAIPALGQGMGTSGTIRGAVLDPSGAAVPGAKVELRNPVSGYDRTDIASSSGGFEFSNVPFNPYHLSVTAPGFQVSQQDVDIRSGVPVELQVTMKISNVATTVTVEGEPADLIETTPTTHTDVDQSLIARLPIENPSIGMSEVITNGTPGVVADANGFFHPLGEHADTTVSVDGLPNSDQQSKIFSNQLPLDAIESMEVISGGPPAQYGDMTSLIVNTTMKSGLGLKRAQGALSSQYGSFGSWTEGMVYGVGGDQWGNFLALSTGGSSRFLDSPEFTAFHDKGNTESLFDRADLQPTTRDSLHLDLSLARSWFQIPNTYDQLAVDQDQRQEIKSLNLSLGWTHLISPTTLVSLHPFLRVTHVQYFPSGDPFSDHPATVNQDRRMAHAGLLASVAYSHGIHNARAGASLIHTFLTENFGLGITDPSFNPVCLDASGDAVTGASLIDPAQCAGAGFQPNPDLAPGLVPYDLTRGGSLFDFHGQTDVKQVALYVQDSMKLGAWKLDAGVRGDIYRGLSRASAVEPRLGISYHVKPTNTVLRVSYSRLFNTPYNENLILSSSTGAGGLAATSFGGFGSQPLVPGRRNQFNVGLEQAFGRHFVVDASYFWKYTHDDFDFDALFSSPIEFPIQWRKSKIDGASVRLNLTDTHGFTAYSVIGTARSRFYGPEVGGLIFNSPLNTAVFRIDHDQAFQQSTHIQYQFAHHGPWVAWTWRYDSGLVAGSVTSLADALALNADQQAAIGFFCGNNVATLANPITTCSLPYPQWGATRVRVPAPGTENDDTNPPRIAPRHLFDLGAGVDNVFHADRYKVNLQFTVINLTNKVALYNFLSTFSGTHFVTPRAWQGQVKLVF
jgi:hypothetical protein